MQQGTGTWSFALSEQHALAGNNGSPDFGFHDFGCFPELPYWATLWRSWDEELMKQALIASAIAFVIVRLSLGVWVLQLAAGCDHTHHALTAANWPATPVSRTSQGISPGLPRTAALFTTPGAKNHKEVRDKNQQPTRAAFTFARRALSPAPHGGPSCAWQVRKAVAGLAVAVVRFAAVPTRCPAALRQRPVGPPSAPWAGPGCCCRQGTARTSAAARPPERGPHGGAASTKQDKHKTKT